jgi:hypothetical protein
MKEGSRGRVKKYISYTEKRRKHENIWEIYGGREGERS